MKFGFMPCEPQVQTEGSYIPGRFSIAANVSGFFRV
jgi:hypothetical protein